MAPRTKADSADESTSPRRRSVARKSATRTKHVSSSPSKKLQTPQKRKSAPKRRVVTDSSEDENGDDDDNDDDEDNKNASRSRSNQTKSPAKIAAERVEREILSTEPASIEKDEEEVDGDLVTKKLDTKVETVQGPNGTMILRQTTTTTVTTITVEEEQTDVPKIFPNLESTPIYRRASLFRSFVLADWITTLNCVCGVASILFCLNYLANNQEDKYLVWAFVCLPFALFFDIIDGAVARKQKKHSPWGSDLDSLSDCISFTLAPAALGFTCGLRSMWDSITLCFFTFCGISRLARYNVTSQTVKPGEKVKYYEGFPVPTSLAIDSFLAFLYWKGLILEKLPFGVIKVLGKDFHLLSILYVVWGCLMVSASIRIPKP